MMRVLSTPPARARHPNYPLSFKLDAVRAVEAGELQCAVCARLAINKSSLLVWLQRYGTAVYQQHKRSQFSATRRRQIVSEVLDGRLSYAEAQVKYGIRWRKTLRSWVRAHHAALANTLPAPLSAPAPPAPDPTEPPATTAALITQLQQARWQVEARHTLIEQVEATYKIEIRKKTGARQSK